MTCRYISTPDYEKKKSGNGPFNTWGLAFRRRAEKKVAFKFLLSMRTLQKNIFLHLITPQTVNYLIFIILRYIQLCLTKNILNRNYRLKKVERQTFKILRAYL